MPNIVSLLVLGIAIGTVGGMLGIGGGVMVIPLLVLFYGWPQRLANGTSLAMLLPPIGIFAVMAYHRDHNINWPVAMILSGGFALGAYFGGVLVNTGRIPETTLRILFSLLLLYVAGRMLFRTDGRAMAALKTTVLIVGFASTYGVMRMLGKRWKKMPYWPSVYQDQEKLPTSQDYEI